MSESKAEDLLLENERPESSSESEETKAYGLQDETISEIQEALREGERDKIVSFLEEASLSDTAQLLEKISREEASEILNYFKDNIDPDIYPYLDPELRRSILSEFEAIDVANILSALDSDDALEMIVNLDPLFQHDIIRKLSSKTRLVLEEGLSFPEDSAGRLMQREYVAVPQFWTVGKTIDYLRAAGEDLPKDFFDIIVIDPTYHVVGEVKLSRILLSGRSEKIENLAYDKLHTIPAEMDQEEAAYIFKREGLGSAPVVDEDGRLLGVITVDDVIDVISEEAQEDLLKMGGIESEGDLYRAVLDTTKSRFRWLLVNLLTAILASIVISFFDTTLQETVALAILMPIVASMGGNAGTQALTVAVRALATKELSGANMYRIIWKETIVGTLNGIGFAFITGILAALWFTNTTLGVIIGLAMIINLLVAGLSGAGIPILIDRLRGDPAISSTVFLTTITDVIGFFAFLGLAALFLI